jgi:hypothetical protein
VNLPGKLPPYRKLQKLIDWLNALRDHVASLQPMQSFNTLTNHTSSGISRQSLGTEGTSASVQFRGEFSQAFAYSNSNLVVVTYGLEAGLYMALKDVPANPTGTATYLPWTGTGYWKLIGRLSDQSSWQ